MKKITIAVDGFSSTGKSTLARQLASALNYVYVDSGAMYRAVTLFAIQNNMIVQEEIDTGKLVQALPEIKIEFKKNESGSGSHIFLNDQDVENQIRNLHVSKYVSAVAKIPEVRVKLVKQQQEMGKKQGVVMDGRDIGTVVFPDAELKIFMTASVEVRAQRRYDELIETGEEAGFEEVLKNIEERDFLDTTREDSPLIKAEDAVEIDNSDLTVEEQFNIVLELAGDRIAAAD